MAIDDVQSAAFNQKVSLLDWDIILFRPEITQLIKYEYDSSEYRGKHCLNERKSFQLREACAHWRREITQATDAGKLVIVFLNAPEQVYVATGSTSTSGTGRNQKVTRHVELCSNYHAIPVETSWTPTVGTAMTLSPHAAELLGPYWGKFEQSSQYNVVWADEAKDVCLYTRHAHKPVGMLVRSNVSPGALCLVPDLEFDSSEFVAEDEEGEVIWTEAAERFAASLVAEAVALSKALFINGAATPEPEWASSSEYALSREIELHRKLLIAEAALESAQHAKEVVLSQLEDAGRLKALLFEKGPRLEAAIIDALRALGFQAATYRDDKSEFDAVFECAEGRLLGEAEGKDTKPINIEKLRQLSTNIHEDLQRDEVLSPAKGILFGNGYRLTSPHERGQQFTDKCISSSKAMSYGLVATNLLYAAAQYLSDHPDENYARQCRLAMIENDGLIVFPDIPKVGA